MAIALYVSFDIVFFAVPNANMHIVCLAVSFASCFATCAYIRKITNPRELKKQPPPLKCLLFWRTRKDLCCSASPFPLSWRPSGNACARKCEITSHKTKEITISQNGQRPVHNKNGIVCNKYFIIFNFWVKIIRGKIPKKRDISAQKRESGIKV